MKITNGDIVDFLAISWNEYQWEFDYPTIVLEPVIRYSPNGESCCDMIEDIAINLSCGIKTDNEDLTYEFDWRGWNLARLKRVVRERLNGKDTWKCKIREVVKQKIRFFEFNGNMEFEVVETIKA